MLRTEVQKEIATLRIDFDRKLETVRVGFKRDLAEQTTKIVLIHGTMLAGGLGLLFAALKLTS